ncbi:MAG: DNA polymerase Y family protein [Akkermansiaceae bacterium]|nr:DNA polymerase Y family protein [Akkermansiaceae bacterium]
MNYAALHFRDLALSSLLTRDGIPPDQPAALLSSGEREKSHLIAVNQAARQFDIHPGLGTTRGLARCADLLLLDPDSTAEKSARSETLAFVDSLVPDFELTTPETYLLDLSTLLMASEADWIAQTIEASTYLALPLQVGLGKTPDLAHLASLCPNQADPLTLKLADLVLAKTFPLPHAPVLQLWGLQTLADLAKLPRQGLAERLGKELARLHDIAHGKHHRLLTLYRARNHYRVTHQFEPPVESHEPLLFMAKRLLQTLCNRLHHHQRAAAEIQLTLAFDNGAAHARKLILSEPSLSPDVLLRTLHTHLETVKAPAPMEEFHLELTPTLPRHAQHQLFSRGLKDPNEFADTLRRLSGILGSNRIGIPYQINTHRPDIVALSPVISDFKTPLAPDITPVNQLPLKRQRPPIPIHVASEKRGRHHHPLALLTGPHQGQIHKARGPFPLSGSWWENGWQQAQWDVELQDSLLLQLAFLPPKQWHLTGIYA